MYMAGYRAKPRWSARQENFIRENYEKIPDEQIATTLGRTLKSVRRKRERMLLKKESGRGICAKYVEKSQQVEEEKTV